MDLILPAANTLVGVYGDRIKGQAEVEKTYAAVVVKNWRRAANSVPPAEPKSVYRKKAVMYRVCVLIVRRR